MSKKFTVIAPIRKAIKCKRYETEKFSYQNIKKAILFETIFLQNIQHLFLIPILEKFIKIVLLKNF